MTNQSQLFLSHLHVDRDISQALQGTLQDAFGDSIEIFNSSNPESVAAGLLWREEITERLKKVDVLLLLATPRSVLSPWVNFESGGAWVLGKPVIPCCAKGMTTSQLPRPFSDPQGIDLSNTRDFEKLLRDLSKRLKQPIRPNFDIGLAASRIDAIGQRTSIVELSPDLERFMAGFESFVSPPENVELSSNYESLLTRHLPTIRELVRQLDAAREWEKIVQVKIRLREFFEYTAEYDEGVKFGRQYIRALDELGKPIEALWTRVKHIGYLLVLARRHGEARRELGDALRDAELLPPSPSAVELRFYCHRYLGISFQRDIISGDRKKAEQHFKLAQQCVDSPLLTNSTKRKELHARIVGNFGNLSLERNDCDRAIELFLEELQFFKELGDVEHIGIAHLKVSQALIQNRKLDKKAALEHLANAEIATEECRWFEGRARIWEQRAKLFKRMAVEAGDTRHRKSYIKQGLAAANHAGRHFRDIEDEIASNRIDKVIASLMTQGEEIERENVRRRSSAG